MKTKKKELTAHEKAVILMNRETDRAVKLLEKLYLETLKAKETVK
jgi:glutamyl-tRNA reductase